MGPERHREQPGMLSSQSKHTKDSGGWGAQERKNRHQMIPYMCAATEGAAGHQLSVGVAVDPLLCGFEPSDWQGMKNTESLQPSAEQQGPSSRTVNRFVSLFCTDDGCLFNFDTFPRSFHLPRRSATWWLVWFIILLWCDGREIHLSRSHVRHRVEVLSTWTKRQDQDFTDQIGTQKIFVFLNWRLTFIYSRVSSKDNKTNNSFDNFS